MKALSARWFDLAAPYTKSLEAPQQRYKDFFISAHEIKDSFGYRQIQSSIV
jgi:hypothetical protein